MPPDAKRPAHQGPAESNAWEGVGTSPEYDEAQVPNLFDFERELKARETDPVTSHQAAATARLNRTADQALVLQIHAQHPFGLTDFELAAIADRLQTSLGCRRGELRDAGLIERTDERRPSPSGSPCIVWRITRAGLSTVVASLLDQGDGTRAAAS